MKQANAIQNESNRNGEDSWNIIYLHKEGKFYHAYEKSAWLIKTVTCTEELQKERGDEKILSANHYFTKNGDYIMLGFPVESINKFITTYSAVQQINENTLAIQINLPESFYDQDLQNMFEQWRNNQPVKDSKKNIKDITVNSDKVVALARSGVFSILTKVLSYPVETMSPADNVEFISNIKQDIIKLL